MIVDEPYVGAYGEVMATRIVPKTELRDRIREELASLGEDSLVITERGRPVAVAVSVDRWNDVQLRLEELEDALAVLEHRLSRDEGKPTHAVLPNGETEAGVRGPRRQAR